MENKTVKFNADLLGILSAVLCLLHCTALPALIFLSTLSFWPTTGDWHWLHYGFIVFSMIAVYWSCKKAVFLIRVLLFGFFVIYAAALLLHEIIPAAIYVSFLASIGLVFLHGINYWKNTPPISNLS